MPAADLPDTSCPVCGRTSTSSTEQADGGGPRCSEGCRRRPGADGGVDARVAPRDTAVEARLDAVLQQLLDARPATSSLCPSEVARAVGGDDWRELMEPARRAARRLVARGEAEITQGGRVVDPSTARGPIRVRRPR